MKSVTEAAAAAVFPASLQQQISQPIWPQPNYSAEHVPLHSARAGPVIGWELGAKLGLEKKRLDLE